MDLNSVCVGLNYFKTGEEVPIKSDSEYPEWIWTHLARIDTYDVVPPELVNCARRRERKLAIIERNAINKELRK